MKEFLTQNKVFIGVAIGTLVLLFGGVFLFSGNNPTQSNGNRVNATLLEPKSQQRTGGIVNGNYIEATSSSKVILVEFGDYECPACAQYNAIVKQVLTEFSGKITFAFKNFPLSQHKNAPISSYAGEAAGLQGKFWQMHDKLYESQSNWSDSSDAKSLFSSYAKDLALDTDQFNKDLESQFVKDIVQSDLADGNVVGINQTPTFYLNGLKLDNPQSFDDFKKAIQESLNK